MREMDDQRMREEGRERERARTQRSKEQQTDEDSRHLFGHYGAEVSLGDLTTDWCVHRPAPRSQYWFHIAPWSDAHIVSLLLPGNLLLTNHHYSLASD